MSRDALDGMYDAFDRHVGLDTERVRKLFLKVCERESIPVVDGMGHPGPSAFWADRQRDEPHVRARRSAPFSLQIDGAYTLR